MSFELTFFPIGLLLLYYGAGWLVSGAAVLSKKIGISPMLIGLTVVAFGSSTPELIVSIISTYKDKNMIAIGNIVGSNICNLTMILGIIASLKSVSTNIDTLRRDISIMLLSSMSLFVMSLNSIISRLDGVILLIGNIAYIYFNYNKEKKDTKDIKIITKNLIPKQFNEEKRFQLKFNILSILVGILSLVIGAELLISSTIKIMTNLGISEKCIGLTIVAIGTSIPELATSVIAITKKQMEISIGNLIGSNIFNILNVIGVTSVIKPIIIEANFFMSGLIVDYTIMLLTSSLPLFLIKNKQSITRIKGLFLITLYVTYIVIVFFRI